MGHGDRARARDASPQARRSGAGRRPVAGVVSRAGCRSPKRRRRPRSSPSACAGASIRRASTSPHAARRLAREYGLPRPEERALGRQHAPALGLVHARRRHGPRVVAARGVSRRGCSTTCSSTSSRTCSSTNHGPEHDALVDRFPLRRAGPRVPHRGRPRPRPRRRRRAAAARGRRPPVDRVGAGLAFAPCRTRRSCSTRARSSRSTCARTGGSSRSTSSAASCCSSCSCSSSASSTTASARGRSVAGAIVALVWAVWLGLKYLKWNFTHFVVTERPGRSTAPACSPSTASRSRWSASTTSTSTRGSGSASSAPATSRSSRPAGTASRTSTTSGIPTACSRRSTARWRPTRGSARSWVRSAGARRPRRPRPRERSRAAHQLAELRDRGVITPEEFEAKKAQLLDRM